MSAVSAIRTEWQPRRRLSPREKVALAGEILTAYARLRRLLARGRALPEVLVLLRTPPPELKPHEGRSPLEVGAVLAGAVVRTLALLPADTRCLMRSLVLISLLSRRGIAADLIIGVRNDSGDPFGAHAWVEYEGRALLLPGHDETRLATL